MKFRMINLGYDGQMSDVTAKWHRVEFDSLHNYDEVRIWCYEQFGPEHYGRWRHVFESSIFFRDERDATMFILRWS
jgi:hypothetical protein